MPFNSFLFLIFFVLFYPIYWLVSDRMRPYMLWFGSLVFYAAFSIPFLIHFQMIVAFNYILNKKLIPLNQDDPTNSASKRKKILRAILLLNLTNLFFFKYTYSLLNALFSVTGLPFFLVANFDKWMFANISVHSIVLPIAISFYTFQLIAFAVDLYRKEIQEPFTPLEFFCFASFFPQLLSGPIQRHSDFFPHLRSLKPDRDRMLFGLYLIMQGVIKKVLFADNLAPYVSQIFSSPESYAWHAVLIANITFIVQIYFDFSGYTDMAVGVARLLGFEMPENFNAPFLSRSIRDLFQRWHVTLSSWLRDYLYIPLGGSRHGEIRTSLNLVLTFTAAGVWHGATLPFIGWGFFLGTMLSGERLLRNFLKKSGLKKESLKDTKNPPLEIKNIPFILLTFFIFVFSAFFFRADSIGTTLVMFQRLFTFSAGKAAENQSTILLFYIVAIFFNFLQFYKYQWKRISNLNVYLKYFLLFMTALLLIIFTGRFAAGSGDFIYYRF